jgi:hypothetical protein
MKTALGVCTLFLFFASSGYAETQKTEAAVPPKAIEALKQVRKAAAATLQPIVIIQKETEPLQLTWWQLLLSELVKLVSLIVGVLASGLLGVLAKKYNFQAQQAKIDFIALQAIDYVEQLSLRGLKLSNAPLDSEAKLKTAIGTAKELASDFKLKQKSEAFWEKTLEGWIRRKKEQQTSVPATEVVPPPA